MNCKVIHIASFKGNLGDNANHLGFREKLKENFKHINFSFTEFEIRSTFRKERAFDEDFVDLLNQHDLAVFGGGNFFELWVDKSSNNTSVDIPIKYMQKIKTPFLFFALGMDISMGYTPLGVSKFIKWLDYVNSQNNFLLSLRNDGSYSTAHKILPSKYANKFTRIPDGGFFVNKLVLSTQRKSKKIGINLAGDMLDIRFNKNRGSITYSKFLTEFSFFINSILDSDHEIEIIFFPHIFKDFMVINDLFSSINEKHARERVQVSNYGYGNNFTLETLKIYRQCEVIIGNRFHSNVCGIALNVPTIGILNYNQIEYLYNELKLSNYLIDVRKQYFSKNLIAMVKKVLIEKKSIQEKQAEIIKSLNEEMDDFMQNILNQFFEKNNIFKNEI